MASFEIVIPDIELPRFSNQVILELSVIIFFCFAVSELFGALLSGSLSLLADSISMFSDVFSYVCNTYVEWYKAQYGRIGRRSRFCLEIIIPGISVAFLIGTTIYTAASSILVLLHPPPKDNVKVAYLYGFSVFNLVIDLFCWILFSLRGKETFIEASEIPQISLDTSISFDDDEAEFGRLDDITFDNALSSSSHNHNHPHELSKYEVLRYLWGMLTCKPEISDKINLNMISAFIHVVGDTLRTIAVLLAAFISTIFKVDGDICDAWAAIIASLTILVLCFNLTSEIRKAWLSLGRDDGDSEEGVALRTNPHSNLKSTKYMPVSRNEEL